MGTKMNKDKEFIDSEIDKVSYAIQDVDHNYKDVVNESDVIVLLQHTIDTVRKNCAELYGNIMEKYFNELSDEEIIEKLRVAKEDDVIYKELLSAPIQEIE